VIHQRQAEADVHSAQEIAFLALKLEIAPGTALTHLWETAKNGIAKDRPHPATGTTLVKNSSQR
jgi:hypothetical protein